jgi:hypothetical protein
MTPVDKPEDCLADIDIVVESVDRDAKRDGEVGASVDDDDDDDDDDDEAEFDEDDDDGATFCVVDDDCVVCVVAEDDADVCSFDDDDDDEPVVVEPKVAVFADVVVADFEPVFVAVSDIAEER